MSKNKIQTIYNILFEKYKYKVKSWWPTTAKKKQDELFEIIIGVILTQNTNWNNVKKAIANLKDNDLLNMEKIKNIEINKLEQFIMPAGFYRQKAIYLKNIAEFFVLNPIEKFNKIKTINARNLLLNVKGIGFESADSILLYALNKRIFVIDAYTKRMAERLNITNDFNYNNLQKIFEQNIQRDIEIYKQYHGLIVEHSKQYCRKRPVCDGCALKQICNYKL